MVEARPIIIGVVSVGILLTLILVPLSFQYIEKNNIGFKKNTATNSVDRSKVYGPGRYHWSLGHTAVQFPSTWQKISLTGGDRLSVFADGGQQLFLEVEFYYRLNRDDLATLYDAFVLNYNNRIKTIAQAELRNAAAQFPLTDYLEQRRNVSNTLYTQLSTELKRKAYVDTARDHFFMQRVYMPGTLLSQKTTIFTTNQAQLTANNTKVNTQIRLETTKQVTSLDTRARLIEENATSTATRLVQDANSRAFQRVETEKGSQLKFIIDTLSVTDTNTTDTLVTLLALLDKSNNANATKPTLMSGVSGTILQNN